MKTTNISENMRRTFAKRFLKWGVLLRESVINSADANVIKKDGWHIKFIEGENDQGHYLEFYTIHAEYPDAHFRIYENGQEEELEALTDGYDYDTTLPGDKTIQRQNFVENNKRVYDLLKNVGLHM